MAQAFEVAPLRRRANRPGLAPLWDELARRYGASSEPVSAVVLRGLEDDARRAIADLLGAERLPPPTTRLTITRLAAALGTDAEGLRRLVDGLRGPLPDRAAERRSDRRRRDELWSWLAAEASSRGVRGWADRLRSTGIPGGDADAHRARLADALAVIDQLPPAEAAPLPAFAADVLGDPHALDAGRRLAAVVLDAVAERLGVEPPRSAEEARQTWARVGVAADPLSPTVLVLGVRAPAEHPLAPGLTALADASEPASLTLSQLQRWPLQVVAPQVVVVENPSVLADAARREWSGPPLVCSAGWPSVAVLTLLRQVAAARTTVSAHADFDVAGLDIVRHLVERVGARPVRMDAPDYDRHAARARIPLAGRVGPTPWDPELQVAMQRRGRALFEEDVRAELLESLSG